MAFQFLKEFFIINSSESLFKEMSINHMSLLTKQFTSSKPSVLKKTLTFNKTLDIYFSKKIVVLTFFYDFL